MKEYEVPAKKFISRVNYDPEQMNSEEDFIKYLDMIFKRLSYEFGQDDNAKQTRKDCNIEIKLEENKYFAGWEFSIRMYPKMKSELLTNEKIKEVLYEENNNND